MPYTMEDYKRETLEERLAGLSPNERVDGLSPNQRLDGLSVNQFLDGLTPENKRLFFQELKEEMNGNT